MKFTFKETPAPPGFFENISALCDAAEQEHKQKLLEAKLAKKREQNEAAELKRQQKEAARKQAGPKAEAQEAEQTEQMEQIVQQIEQKGATV